MRNSALFFIMLSFATATAQELNCKVQVLAPQIATVDKKVFEAMQTSITEFLNNTKWTKDIFQNDERIECSIQITLSKQTSSDAFEGNIQVTSARTTYKTSHSSPMFNYVDKDFQINYIQFQALEFSENAHLSNLTSILSYYAYVIIGIDYDSFSLYGGTPWFQKAQKIVNNAQSAPELGWKGFDGTENRYWLVENFLEKTFAPIRECTYRYHRLGLDIMAEKRDEGRGVIAQSIELLKTIHQNRPSSFNMKVFFMAKAQEVVDIFSPAPGPEKVQVLKTLNEIDPGNTMKYQKILNPN